MILIPPNQKDISWSVPDPTRLVASRQWGKLLAAKKQDQKSHASLILQGSPRGIIGESFNLPWSDPMLFRPLRKSLPIFPRVFPQYEGDQEGKEVQEQEQYDTDNTYLIIRVQADLPRLLACDESPDTETEESYDQIIVRLQDRGNI
jgi:hypothetical protein